MAGRVAVGSDVEVVYFDEYEGLLAPGKVVKLSSDAATVTGLDDAGGWWEEEYPIERVRPIPPPTPRGWQDRLKLGDPVEAFNAQSGSYYQNCTLLLIDASGSYLVRQSFPFSRQRAVDVRVETLPTPTPPQPSPVVHPLSPPPRFAPSRHRRVVKGIYPPPS